MHQLGGGPKPVWRERSYGAVVDQTDQIEFVGHRRELTADGLPSENESAVEHGPNSATEAGCRTMDFQRAVSSVLTGCLTRGAHPTMTPSSVMQAVYHYLAAGLHEKAGLLLL